MFRILLFISLFVFNISYVFSQRSVAINEKDYDAKTAIGIVGGLNGFQTAELELGIGINLLETRPDNNKFTKPFMGLSIAANFYPSNNSLIGQNLSVWLNSLIVFGLSEQYYKFNSSETLTIKPFVGLEFYGITLTYGRNLFLTNNNIPELSKNNFSIRYFQYIKKFRN
jgi:hypothetical protein